MHQPLAKYYQAANAQPCARAWAVRCRLVHPTRNRLKTFRFYAALNVVSGKELESKKASEGFTF